MTLYDGDKFTHDGAEFELRVEADDYVGEPWKNMDTLGDVSDWQRAREYHNGRATFAKAPGQRVLFRDRDSVLLYDYAGAVAKARKEGCTGQEAVKAVDFEFNYLRRWCEGDWHYVSVFVRCTEFDDDDPTLTDSISGVESDAYEYIEELAHECAAEALARKAVA